MITLTVSTWLFNISTCLFSIKTKQFGNNFAKKNLSASKSDTQLKLHCHKVYFSLSIDEVTVLVLLNKYANFDAIDHVTLINCFQSKLSIG